ncbi:M50 family metallopeptidase [Myxococcus qinghaiensis]|uniref:M50 family metallopeptidase n=1 Tax=Myxococcus qinghaiensis TaxID=2906758 RepID=UPI0020A7924F|nr:M50 family metallopeptidase [Myxococcus qinghaiensis]MCP3169217.1 M50 family metallopeptidase [Myxococcus qinghaiensis]
MRPHFHVDGFPVRVHPLFFLTTLATGWDFASELGSLALWVVVVFASVLLHELGHAWAYRRFGSTASISLHGMGGTAQGTDRLTHRQSAWVSFAGPGVGFLLGGLVWGTSVLTPLGEQGGLVGLAVRQLLWVNIGWGLFNLLPVQPLDGGNLLASLVRARKGYRYERALRVIGIITAMGMVGLAIWQRTVWVGVMALMFGVMNLEQLRQLPREVPFQPASPPRKTATRRASVAGAVTLDELLGRGPPPPAATLTEIGASEAMAPVLARRAPEDTRHQEEPEAPHDPAAVGQLLLDSGLAGMAVKPLQEAFARAPSPRAGHTLVLALLETGRTAELGALLTSPRSAHLSLETLGAIEARAGGDEALTGRVTVLRRAAAPKLDEQG